MARIGSRARVAARAEFRLDERLQSSILIDAPREFTPAAERAPVIMLPRPDGTLEAFAVVDSPVMHPVLAAKYPQIRTYAAQGVDDPAAVARISINVLGFFATVLAPDGDYAVAPLDAPAGLRRSEPIYVSAFVGDLGSAIDCGTAPAPPAPAPDPSILVSTGDRLRTFQMAFPMEANLCVNVAGGTVEGGLSAVATAVNAVNAVWERELAIRLILFPESDRLIFTNIATNPYNISTPITVRDGNQSIIDQFTDAPYDAGHAMAWISGGIAMIGSVCGPNKGFATSGDFWTPLVFSNPQTMMHELGHQFKASHSWNSPNGQCGAPQWAALWAFEPGSGSTLMAYAGLCSPDNIQSSPDNYYSQGSQQQITDFVASLACAGIILTTNHAPVVSSTVFNNDVVPIGTPFELAGSATDSDGDALTYVWEQRDTGPQRSLAAGDGGSGPLFRSVPPSASGNVRVFPALSAVLSGNLSSSIGEILPTTTRTLRFRLTARDNRAGGGGVHFVDRSIRSISTAGPFKVTAPSGTESLSGATVVRWDMKGTTGSPFSDSKVNIRLSTDGGITFPTLLKGATANDGVEPVTLPQIGSVQARIMVRPTDGLYFDISDSNMALAEAPVAARVSSGGAPIIADTFGNGNANGVPEPGESDVQAWFDLLGTGLIPATNVHAVVESLTPGVVVKRASIDFADLSQGMLDRNDISALISIDPSVHCGSDASIRLNIVSDQGTFVIDHIVKLGSVSNSCAEPSGYCAGDLDTNSLVDDADFVLFAAAYNVLEDASGDLNADAITDDADFTIFAAAYNELVCP